MRVPLGIGEKLLLFIFTVYVANRFFGCYAALAIFVSALGLQFYIYYRAATLWARLGVPSAPAWPLLGHIPQTMKKGFHGCDMEWMEKFGKLYGSYLFTQPEIVIADEALLKKVLVKDFHNFTNRRTFVMSNKSLFNRMVSALKDDDWKNTRSAITPAFTSGKLKGTVHLMENCVNTMCSILSEQTDFENGLDVKQVMGNMTMDVIGAAAFALNVDAQRNPDNEFTKHAKVLGSITFKDWRIMISIFFPWTLVMLDEYFDIRIFMPGMEEFYMQNLMKVIKERRQDPHIENLDFLQLLINQADNNNEKQDDAEVDSTIDHRQAIGSTNTSNKKWQLSDRDIVAQSFLFLFAGHETTATTLAFACYLLAWNPEAQEKAHQEIMDLAGKDEAINYNHIQNGMPYLDAVIAETLRIFPPAVRFDRECIDDYQLTDELTIPKKSIVCVPVYAIHHSAENYEDPEKFEPERFLDKNIKQANPFTYMPFGYGPRNCIGMRFAQLEAKLALSNVVRKFRIETCPKTEPYPPALDIQGLLHTKNPLHLNFKRRTD